MNKYEGTYSEIRDMSFEILLERLFLGEMIGYLSDTIATDSL